MPAHHLKNTHVSRLDRALWRRRKCPFNGVVTYEQTTLGLAWAIAAGAAAWVLRSLF